MENISNIMRKAALLGACQQSGKVSNWKSLVWLFFTPQGREFCKDNSFPTLDMFREMATNIEEHGVFVEKAISKHNQDVALIGKRRSELSFSGVDRAYKVILMHGAQATIKAENYAVIRIENISGKYEIINDGTATILE